MSDRFIIPGFRSTPAQRCAVIARLNTVALTIEQFERGWDLYERTQVRVMRGELPREAPMAALEDFWSGVEAVPVTLRESWVHTRRHDRAFADRQ